MLLLASPCETDSSSTGGTRTEAEGLPQSVSQAEEAVSIHSDVSLLNQAEVPQVSSVQRGCCSAVSAYLLRSR